MYISSAAVEPNTELILDPAVLKERGNTYTSLSDLYQISVFTNDLYERTGKIQKKKIEQENEMREGIFLNKEVADDQDTYLQQQLFTSSTSMAKKQDYVAGQHSYAAYLMSAGVLIAIVFGAVLFRYSQIRKKKRLEYTKEYYHG